MRELATRCARFGTRIAVRTPNGTLSYGELAARIAAVGGRLDAAGVRPFERVVLRCPPTVETIASALALLDRSCTVLPVADDATAESLRAPLAAFAPAWHVCEGKVSAAIGATAAPAAADAGDRPVQALLSSGSVGQPKIVLRSASQVEAGVRIFTSAMYLGPDDAVLLLVPLAHSFGFNSVMLGALSTGATIVLPGTRHPRGIVNEVEASGVTLFPAPPVFFDWMHRFADRAPRRLGSVRACVAVGDIVPQATYAGFVDTFGVALWQSYGASEAGPALLNTTGACAGDAMALGVPYPEVSVDIRAEEGGAAAEGEVGELTVRSPAVGLGYLGERDGASRIVGREFYTGDLGFRRGGLFHFAGRTKILITRAGRKIDPAEIERVLCSHPVVIDAAVCVAGDSGHAPLQALVVAREALAPEALIAHCARTLEAHKVPRHIEFRSTLPRDATGKLQRGRLSTW